MKTAWLRKLSLYQFIQKLTKRSKQDEFHDWENRGSKPEGPAATTPTGIEPAHAWPRSAETVGMAEDYTPIVMPSLLPDDGYLPAGAIAVAAARTPATVGTTGEESESTPKFATTFEQSGYEWAIYQLRKGATEESIDNIAIDNHPFDRGAQRALADWKEEHPDANGK